MRRSVALWGLLVFSGAACQHGRPATPDRFLYQLSCDAKLERFDTATRQRTGTYDLTKASGSAALVPTVVGPLEVCLTNQTVFDPRASVFYTLVPLQARPRDDGTMAYRVLGFSIPAVALVTQVAAGSPGLAFQRPPHLALDPMGGVRVVGASDWPPRMTEDLSLFAIDHDPAPNRILEMSGHRALLSLTGAPGGPVFAVADEASRTLVRLQGPVSTTNDNVHLTPGGTHVLVEETVTAGSRATKTGRVRLYDGATGVVTQSFVAPQTEKMSFRGISPGGKVLYDLLDRYWFLDLGRTFTTDPVERSLQPEFPPPSVFFSDR
jgi:hypothetical protein